VILWVVTLRVEMLSALYFVPYQVWASAETELLFVLEPFAYDFVFQHSLVFVHFQQCLLLVAAIRQLGSMVPK